MHLYIKMKSLINDFTLYLSTLPFSLMSKRLIKDSSVKTISFKIIIIIIILRKCSEQCNDKNNTNKTDVPAIFWQFTLISLPYIISDLVENDLLTTPAIIC